MGTGRPRCIIDTPSSCRDRRTVDRLASLKRSPSTPRGTRPQTDMNGRVFGNIPQAFICHTALVEMLGMKETPLESGCQSREPPARSSDRQQVQSADEDVPLPAGHGAFPTGLPPPLCRDVSDMLSCIIQAYWNKSALEFLQL
ncbi:unnamed protein product [Rangifer tarandus platyrhynchus]|uniref:Uncharacterized protein n=1 Tax=Rangifer tarandus platyrhynchus TaxID=3082113 RepID=A0AC59ZHC9_RANTA